MYILAPPKKCPSIVCVRLSLSLSLCVCMCVSSCVLVCHFFNLLFCLVLFGLRVIMSCHVMSSVPSSSFLNNIVIVSIAASLHFSILFIVLFFLLTAASFAIVFIITSTSTTSTSRQCF